ncbi:winged helix-turn-helix domain-containing protein, partial [Enterobacter hormaechei]|uniref:winged helix-turn-helix domain-containing protein n=1 Tax=Enterobacter hormaechei TaxID=158836 RepID=UPI00197AF865
KKFRHNIRKKLTAFEYTIMETLIRNNGKVVSKDSLMLQLYPDAELRESHTIDVLMGRLRKKIQAQYPQETDRVRIHHYGNVDTQ